MRVQSSEGPSEQKKESLGRYVGMKHHDVIGQCWVDRARSQRALDTKPQELGLTFPSVFGMCKNVLLPRPSPSGP